MTRKLSVKKEIRTLGLDYCKTRRLVGVIMRGGVYLDGVVVFPSSHIPNSRSIASAILETRFFPELRLIMTHDPETRLNPRTIERLTKLPVIQVKSSRERNSIGFKPYTIGRNELQVKSSLPPGILQEILSITWTTGILPESLRIAHLLARSRFFREKHEFPSQQINSPAGANRGERVLQFCPKCGSTLLPAKREKKVFMACGKCGFTSNRGDKQVSRLAHEREKIVVIGREEQKIRTLPKTKAECPKCNNHEAFYWLVQTRGGDESSTQFFRCTNCGATWRENS